MDRLDEDAAPVLRPGRHGCLGWRIPWGWLAGLIVVVGLVPLVVAFPGVIPLYCAHVLLGLLPFAFICPWLSMEAMQLRSPRTAASLCILSALAALHSLVFAIIRAILCSHPILPASYRLLHHWCVVAEVLLVAVCVLIGQIDPASPLWTALSLAARSAALAGVLALAVVVALVAWLVLRATLSVDPVVGRERVWLQYGEHRPPYALVPLQDHKYSTPGQVYDLALDLTVPVNPNNLDLGNFMVALSLVDAAGERVLNASRPAILSHPSAQSCLVPSPRSSTLSRLLSLPFAFFAPSRAVTTAASCLAPFTSSARSSTCTQTLRIPLLERASLVAPSSSASAPKRSFWRRAKARPVAQGPATALYVQLGREDAYPSLGAAKREGVATREVGERPRELQVYEAWVRVEVKLSGVRAFLHSHPYLLFATFLPSFLALELLAALVVYVLFVVRAAPGPSTAEDFARRVKRETPARPAALEEEEEDGDVKPRPFPAARRPPSPLRAFEEAERVAAEQRRALRMRLGPGGVGMSEAFEESEVTATEEEEEEGTEVGESVSEAGAEGVEEEEEELAGQVKEEEGEEGTVAGSATTRRTASTFGPSLAGTTSTRTTGLSAGASSAGLRGRGTGAGGGEAAERE
ncbi:hypothetical protein JCM10450v2_007583 [Rhodotorula kratochvilovae]